MNEQHNSVKVYPEPSTPAKLIESLKETYLRFDQLEFYTELQTPATYYVRDTMQFFVLCSKGCHYPGVSIFLCQQIITAFEAILALHVALQVKLFIFFLRTKKKSNNVIIKTLVPSASCCDMFHALQTIYRFTTNSTLFLASFFFFFIFPYKTR